jgi:hypothetical protein
MHSHQVWLPQQQQQQQVALLSAEEAVVTQLLQDAVEAACQLAMEVLQHPLHRLLPLLLQQLLRLLLLLVLLRSQQNVLNLHRQEPQNVVQLAQHAAPLHDALLLWCLLLLQEHLAQVLLQLLPHL